MLQLCNEQGLKGDLKSNVIKSCYECIGMFKVRFLSGFALDNYIFLG